MNTYEFYQKKVQNFEPLSFEEGLDLFNRFTLHQLGHLADSVRKHRHGNKAYYVVNAHINPTNICRIGCPLCAFAAKPEDDRAYILERDDILQRVRRAAEFGVTQIHLVSSVHPSQPFAWYRGMLAEIHNAYPALHLKAWTAVEVAAFAELENRSIEEILCELKSAGLNSMPGGGAEIFDAEIRSVIAPKKIPAQTYIAVHRTAHRLGIPTNTSMLFGHIEKPEHRIQHLIQLRELQNETGGFYCFVPLVFHPKNTQIHTTPVSPQEILKTIALCRLMLNNFEHIKAYWVTLGESLAQIALSYGADDFDGTVFEERIHHDAGSAVPRGLSVTRIRELITGAACIPSLSSPAI